MTSASFQTHQCPARINLAKLYQTGPLSILKGTNHILPGGVSVIFSGVGNILVMYWGLKIKSHWGGVIYFIRYLKWGWGVICVPLLFVFIKSHSFREALDFNGHLICLIWGLRTIADFDCGFHSLANSKTQYFICIQGFPK